MLLPNTRILVIDDILKEVQKLLYTLNKQGIAFNYYKSYSELPRKPLKGIRLLFLDFELETGGASDKTKISKLMEFIKRTISRDNGPYIIIAWTQHTILIDLFKKEIMKSDYIHKPLAIIDMEKKECMKSLTKIKNKIKEKINDKGLMEILLQWENNACSASGDVLNTLTDISKPTTTESQSYDEFSSDWNSELERHIYWIAQSYLGKNIKADKNLLISAQFSLTPIFQDHIEYRIKNETNTLDNLTHRIYSKNTKKYKPQEKALMNTTFLLITKNLPKGIKPGNIYLYTPIFKKINCKKEGCYTNKIKVSKVKLIEEFYYKKLRTYTKRKNLINKTKIIMMEITPGCDYAQEHMNGGKFIFGALWPENLSDSQQMNKKIQAHTNYIYQPLPILYNNEIYYLTFNSRHFCNINLNLFDNIKPLLIARKELLVDIQHWFSKQISRPGKTEF